jgi:hypothetical protein
MLTSDKNQFKAKNIMKDKNDHYLIYRGFNSPKRIKSIKLYATKNIAPK